MVPIVFAVPDIGLSLALAVISSSTAPLILLDADLSVISASVSFYRSFELDEAAVAGSPLADLGQGEWNVRQLSTLLKATVAGSADVEAYEMDLNRHGRAARRLVLNARKLDYADKANVRLLLAVSDITEARIAAKLKSDLLRDKEVLLQELKHRVANSLQIIASVLLQSARRVQSDEARSHLHAAHQRVMSVASVQQQLSVTSLDEVNLRRYFGELCESLGASMIRDHNQLTLTATTDDSVATADVSVSLGLIVTELVINALKHAFPEDRGGAISVAYTSRGLDWDLSVGDDGVGMPEIPAKSGLGTSLVQALAKALHARVAIADAHPGTVVSVTHTHAPAEAEEAEFNEPAI